MYIFLSDKIFMFILSSCNICYYFRNSNVQFTISQIISSSTDNNKKIIFNDLFI